METADSHLPHALAVHQQLIHPNVWVAVRPYLTDSPPYSLNRSDRLRTDAQQLTNHRLQARPNHPDQAAIQPPLQTPEAMGTLPQIATPETIIDRSRRVLGSLGELARRGHGPDPSPLQQEYRHIPGQPRDLMSERWRRLRGIAHWRRVRKAADPIVKETPSDADLAIFRETFYTTPVLAPVIHERLDRTSNTNALTASTTALPVIGPLERRVPHQALQESGPMPPEPDEEPTVEIISADTRHEQSKPTTPLLVTRAEVLLEVARATGNPEQIRTAEEDLCRAWQQTRPDIAAGAPTKESTQDPSGQTDIQQEVGVETLERVLSGLRRL